MAQAKTRQPQGPATGKSQASAKANRAKAKPAATRPVKPLRTLNKTKTHRVRNFICAVIAFIFALAALLGTVTHMLPEELQALPYMPIVVSLVPWFTLLAVIALVCAIISKRTVSIVMAVLAIALQTFWQYPFFYQPSKLPRAAVAAASGETVNTDDGYARLMTCNVYKGRADAREIVDLVRSEHVEVLALQETTDAFVDDLNRAGIASYLPYAQVSSSDGVYGNGLWSASPLDDPSDDDVIRARRSCRAAPFRSMGEPRRCVSYPCIPRRRRTITGSSGSGRSTNWRNYVSTLADGTFSWVISTRRTTIRRSATFWETVSPTPPSGGEGLKFSWPANVDYVPSFAGIDHIVLDSGMQAGQVRTVKVDGSDHKALLAIVRVG
ncbi:endonuclease/CDSuclease/phosphatase [Bifidobacterium adolescentis]|nr:endonuclease/CDSuclease/phosphatase [Bifidobacterium adolescentis]